MPGDCSCGWCFPSRSAGSSALRERLVREQSKRVRGLALEMRSSPSHFFLSKKDLTVLTPCLPTGSLRSPTAHRLSLRSPRARRLSLRLRTALTALATLKTCSQFSVFQDQFFWDMFGDLLIHSFAYQWLKMFILYVSKAWSLRSRRIWEDPRSHVLANQIQLLHEWSCFSTFRAWGWEYNKCFSADNCNNREALVEWEA